MEEREGSNSFDRRRFVKGAATVAWATPLILTLGAGAANAQLPPGPSPAQCLGSTGRPEGCPCLTSAQCADGCCCSVDAGAPGGGCTSASNCNDLMGSCVN
jgi:hypothetical protein